MSRPMHVCVTHQPNQLLGGAGRLPRYWGVKASFDRTWADRLVYRFQIRTTVGDLFTMADCSGRIVAHRCGAFELRGSVTAKTWVNLVVRVSEASSSEFSVSGVKSDQNISAVCDRYFNIMR